MKKHLPNLITCCNLLCGAAAAVYALQGCMPLAFSLILAGAVFDFFDGMTARALKVSGPLGIQMDSLADEITFGFAPAVLLYSFLKPLLGCYALIALIMAAFAAYRLAKFNIDERQTTSFIGLATPANALFWGGITCLPQDIMSQTTAWIMIALSFVSGYLMICEIPFFSLKLKSLRWKESKIQYIFLIGSLVLTAVCIAEAIHYKEMFIALFAGTAIIVWYFIMNIINNTYIRFLVLLIIFIPIGNINAEDIPEGYYSQADGLKDSQLKSALHTAVGNGIRYAYGTNQYHTTNKAGEWNKGDLKAYGTWQAFPLTDMTEEGTIWDMYSCCVRYYPNKRGESACSMNIEHCLPKSWWGGTVNDAYNDLYNLNPSDQRANSQKSNFPPGHVSAGDKFDNGSFRMDSKKSSSYGYVCFEPAEEYRGDFARTYFYMATAYEDLDWQETYKDYINPASYLFFSNDIITVLLDWHRADPVSDKEICRADRISSIQHNRNPYIDYPELVEYIWGNKKGETADFSELVCTTGTATCTLPDVITDTETGYDTIVALPILTKAYISDISGGYASDKVQSNGTASITMGTSTTDGAIGFTGLNIGDNTFIRFRASVYNTAERMQIDISADGQLIESVRDTSRQETRNEIWYSVRLPKNTKTVELLSVGGSTSVRACMQELYILQEKGSPAALAEVSNQPTAAYKYMKDGTLLIHYDGNEYNISGTRQQ